MDASTLYRELLDMGADPKVINEYIYQYGAVEGCRRVLDLLKEESGG